MNFGLQIGLIAILILIKCLGGKSASFEGCPIFDINKRVFVMQNSRSSKPSHQSDITAYKIFTDKELIYSKLSVYLDKNELCDLNTANSLNIMFPSAIWLSEKNAYLAVVRLFVNLKKSYLYASFFDSNWNEIIAEDKMGTVQIPGILPIEVYDYNVFCSGPEDPRIFKFGNETYVIYNMIDVDLRRKMWLYQFETGETWPLKVIEHTLGKYYAEKNWTPIIIDDEHLYFVYNHKNFQILDCTYSQIDLCKRVSGELHNLPAGLRGGSPYVRFSSTNYFVSFGYSHLNYNKRSGYCTFYRPILTIATVMNLFDFKNLLVEPFTDYNSTEYIKICESGRIMMALSIANWDYGDDIADIVINLNDKVPLVARIFGITDLVLDVISMHQQDSLYGESDCVEKLVNRHFNSKNKRKSKREIKEKYNEKTSRDNV